MPFIYYPFGTDDVDRRCLSISLIWIPRFFVLLVLGKHTQNDEIGIFIIKYAWKWGTPEHIVMNGILLDLERHESHDADDVAIAVPG